MMIELEYEMTYAETIEGPLGPTTDSPLGERVCWQVTAATLNGPRINATLAMPGTDWIRLGADGIRRPDLRAQLVTDDGELILLRYDLALIRSNERFLAALAGAAPTARPRCGDTEAGRSMIGPEEADGPAPTTRRGSPRRRLVLGRGPRTPRLLCLRGCGG
jgi:hypothetical protein